MKISVNDRSVERVLYDILRTLQRMDQRAADQALIAGAIRRNTAALSVLTTRPPAPPKENNMSEGSVDSALAEQTDAIARLAGELATEHEQWVAATQSGDTGAAEAIVAKVRENTDQLNQLADDLASSVPGGNPDDQPHPDQTLPGDLK